MNLTLWARVAFLYVYIIKIMHSTPQLLHHPPKNHELNYEGCRCQLCERITLEQNKRIRIDLYHDRQSENWHPHHHKEAYLDLIDQLALWEKMPRKLRLALPQTCVFFEGSPEYWITKNKDSAATKLIRSKSKMNMFQIQHFLLEGFLLHHPKVTNKKKGKDSFKEDCRRQCIVAAKYSNNVTQLLTLDQIQHLFKSKHKYMRDGLMYLQTLVGAHHSQEVIIKLDLKHAEQAHKDLFQRAKQEAKIFVGETKVTDLQYYPEKAEIQFQRHLRKDSKRYLTYLSLKLVLFSSKLQPTVMRQAIFKWSCVGGSDFLWDLRIHKQTPSAAFWQNAVVQALQVKLAKTMSMMELQPQHDHTKEEHLSAKAREFSKWLDSSTEKEWGQMRLIRLRLEKLETQKKALLQSQKNDHGKEENTANKSFRMRIFRKRDSVMQPNPQY